jgi:hypothetical protein
MASTKPQTEIAFIPLKPNVDVSSDEHKQVLLDALAVIRRQEGCKAVYWGVPLEKERGGEVEVVIGTSHVHFTSSYSSRPSSPNDQTQELINTPSQSGKIYPTGPSSPQAQTSARCSSP